MTPAVTEPPSQSDHHLPDVEQTQKAVQAPVPLISTNGVLGTQDTDQIASSVHRSSENGTHTGGSLHNCSDGHGGAEASNGVENSNGLEVLNGVNPHVDRERHNESVPKNGIRNKLLEQVVRTPGRMPSPQPTHLSVATAAVHRVLHEEGPGYVAPKFEGKELQMDQGKLCIFLTKRCNRH